MLVLRQLAAHQMAAQREGAAPTELEHHGTDAA